MINQLKNAIPILRTIESYGHEAYFVGGCVRDVIRKQTIKDIDIATSALPEEIQVIFSKVIPVGIDHGTVIVRYQGNSYEVTTFRDEGEYSDKRHPDEVTFIRDLKQDLARRDFTMNALAMDKDGNIIDPYGGKEDIEDNMIRTVGNARHRFNEDALRMLRAIRFSSQLGFRIEKKTFQEITALHGELQAVAVERIREECTKFFQGNAIKHGLNWLKQSRLCSVLPIFAHYPHLIEQTPAHVTPFFTFADVIAFYHYLEQEVSIANWIKSWKCSNREKQQVIEIVDALHYYDEHGVDHWLVYSMNEENIHRFVHVHELLFPTYALAEERLFELKRTVPISSKTELCINGHDIHVLFPALKKGSWIKQLLDQIEYNVVLGNLKNDKKRIKEWIACHPPDKN